MKKLKNCLSCTLLLILFIPSYSLDSKNVDTWSITFMGDLMLNGIHPKAGSDYPFQHVKSAFEDSDIVFANLESPLTRATIATLRKSKEDVQAHHQWLLKASPRFAKTLKLVGYTALSCANNHAMDWQERGMRDTFRALDKVKIKHPGEGGGHISAHKAAFLNFRNHRIAILAYLAFKGSKPLHTCTPCGNYKAGIAIIPSPKGFVSEISRRTLRRDINEAKKSADVVIISFHWGTERASQPTNYQRTLAHTAINLGASLVIGHHPHVLQPYETYKGKLIFYSMGNFVAPNCRGVLGESMIVKLTFSGNDVIEKKLIPVKISSGVPRLLTGEHSISALQKFNRQCGQLKTVAE